MSDGDLEIRTDSRGESISLYRLYPFIPTDEEMERNVINLARGFGYKVYTAKKWEKYSVFVGTLKFVENMRRNYGGGEIRIILENGFELPVA